MNKKHLISWAIRLGSITLVSVFAGYFANATTTNQNGISIDQSEASSNAIVGANNSGDSLDDPNVNPQTDANDAGGSSFDNYASNGNDQNSQDNSPFFQSGSSGHYHPDTRTGGS
jgi:hypothetical protein